jgi:CheY-like chemotaxis protein
VTTPSPTVLIVEDRADQAESLDLLLRALGYNAHMALSYCAAEEKARTHPPDGVILDWVIPGPLRGTSDRCRPVEFMAWLARHAPAARVVVTTGLPEGADAELDEAERRGVRVLRKPADALEMLKALGLLA